MSLQVKKQILFIKKNEIHQKGGVCYEHNVINVKRQNTVN